MHADQEATAVRCFGDLYDVHSTPACPSYIGHPHVRPRSLAAMHFFYENDLMGPAGFYDAFSPQYSWVTERYLAIDQGPQIIMIENYRTGLLWNLFMQNEDVQNGLDTLGFTY